MLVKKKLEHIHEKLTSVLRLKRLRRSNGYLMANQLRRGEIGEPVELVAQIVQDGPTGLNC